ncbi:hypothetical protein [Streptomyces sp. Ncost-T10-10d]|uniref:hypothetical protein n=1 Tax=Streptomyces sp. Ncost-T10-10d TaxID=1839774 RepID=UPI00081E0123|nr:hypothetical protein [Streptomyces sp. Ncost-T10-10d]SCF95952.1 hypothetical protein GA0115254_127715 [Streptomyces sp. Ncost-T10-10d]
MRRQIRNSTGRRGTVIAASAAVLCLGGALAACGGGTADDGYVAVGAAGAGPERTPSGAVAPSGKVTLVPLDRGGKGGGSAGDRADGGGPSPSASVVGDGSGGTSAASGAADRPTGAIGPRAGGAGSGTGSTGGATGGTTGPGDSGGPGGDPTGPATPSAPGSTAPAGPAVLVVGAPERASADERWCEKVTVEFRNTGGSSARSGTVTFATHIIGGLGIDWATVESSGPLPAPIDAGAARTKTYTVCVDAWRVPLGMHVETRDVTAVLK